MPTLGGTPDYSGLQQHKAWMATRGRHDGGASPMRQSFGQFVLPCLRGGLRLKGFLLDRGNQIRRQMLRQPLDDGGQLRDLLFP